MKYRSEGDYQASFTTSGGANGAAYIVVSAAWTPPAALFLFRRFCLRDRPALLFHLHFVAHAQDRAFPDPARLFPKYTHAGQLHTDAERDRVLDLLQELGD